MYLQVPFKISFFSLCFFFEINECPQGNLETSFSSEYDTEDSNVVEISQVHSHYFTNVFNKDFNEEQEEVDEYGYVI